MQQIERYGVMVLLLMLVTILVVSLWDGEVDAAPGPKDGRAKQVATAKPARNKPAGQATNRPRRTATQNRETRSVPIGASTSRNPSTGTPRRQRGANRAASQQPSTPARQEIRTVGSQLSTPANPSTLPPRNTPGAGGASDEPVPSRMAGGTPTSSNPSSERSRRARYASENPSETPRRSTEGTLPTREPVATRSEPAARTPQPRAMGWTYEVKPGDTLGGIAARVLGNENRWREIQDANSGLDPRRLMVGAKIKLPGRSSTGAVVSSVTPRTTRTEPVRTASSTPGIYVVKKGDVLSRVAQSQLGSAGRWREIVDLNPGLDPNRMHVGAKLVMPGGTRATAPRTGNSSAPRVAVADTGSSSSADERFRVR